jgi:glycosyltransferase involved in cell wall biosynthesis
VLGQYKPARDLDILRRLPAELPDYSLEIAGRGWPLVEGWSQDVRFLEETELAEKLHQLSAVILPYRDYFQSGIAMRALEQGTAVVGSPTWFLADLLGADYSGYVSTDAPGEWASAVRRVADADVTDAHARLVGVVDHDWRTFLCAWADVVGA